MLVTFHKIKDGKIIDSRRLSVPDSHRQKVGRLQGCGYRFRFEKDGFFSPTVLYCELVSDGIIISQVAYQVKGESADIVAARLIDDAAYALDYQE